MHASTPHENFNLANTVVQFTSIKKNDLLHRNLLGERYWTKAEEGIPELKISICI